MRFSRFRALVVGCSLLVLLTSKSYSQDGKNGTPPVPMQATQANSKSPSTPALTLDQAVTSNDLATVLKLIESVADVNAKSTDGKTPLHIAIGLKSPIIAHVLVRNGADVSLRSAEGQTAADVLKEKKVLSKTFPDAKLPKFLELCMMNGIKQNLDETKAACLHAKKILELRTKLIKDHRKDQARLKTQVALYATRSETKYIRGTASAHYMEYGIDDTSRMWVRPETIVHAPTVPSEFNEDLALEYPQQEVDEAIECGIRTVIIAELTYGSDSKMFQDIRNAVSAYVKSVKDAVPD